jgi:hypothetical protein
MSYSTEITPVGQITRPRCPADSWPAWCDLVSVTLPIGADDRKPPSIWKVDLADLIESCISFAACDLVDPRDFLGDEEDLDGPIGPLPDLRDPSEWPDGPDGDPHATFPGIASLALRRAGIAPIAGGSPVYTDDELEDHLDWLSSLDAGYPPEDQPEPARRSDLDPAVLARVHKALYGTATPFSA